MEIRYDPRFSLEETTAQIDELEQYVGVGKTPFVEHETVIDLQHAIQNRVAYAASELMTGARLHSERKKYLDAYAGYRQLLGCVALDVAQRTYDEYGDIDKTKKTVKRHIMRYELELAALDYEKRLHRSPLERTKQKIAQSDKARSIVPFTLSRFGNLVGIAATAMYVQQNEMPAFSSIDLTPTQKGLAAAATLAVGMSVRPAIRGVSNQVGSVIGNQVGDSFFRYVLEKFDEDENEENSAALENLVDRYALRDLKAQLHETGDRILESDVENKDDLGLMVANALDVNEYHTHRRYAVDPNNEWAKEWYLRWPSKLTRIDLRSFK